MATTIFLSIQGSYTDLEIALFQNSLCKSQIKETNQKASSLLIPYIEKILKENSLTISDLNFISADQGPGAFTSLRVTISTINGLGFAKKIPLIGIDGLDALAQETLHNFFQKNQKENPEILISLLNAYNNDVYFAINRIINNQKLELTSLCDCAKGYKKIDLLLDEIKKKFRDEKILFTGNGVQAHKDLIQENLGNSAIFFPLQTCSTNQIAKMALEFWNKKENLRTKLYPLYLKAQIFAVRPGATKSSNASNKS
jgi:tRNA threonylcarbamoyladenosine biosynthesis protein TsaB